MTKNRCKARTKTGEPCRAYPTSGGFCFFHANPDKAAELGQIGGLKNRRLVPDAAIPALLPLDSAMAVRNAIAQLFNDVHSGRINPKVANSLTSLLKLEAALIDSWDLVQEMERLKKIINEAKLQKSVDGKHDTPALDGDEVPDEVGEAEPEDDSSQSDPTSDPEPEEG
jgi:Family of unknown function (DUF5763)